MPFVCGNWKMHRTPSEARVLASELRSQVDARQVRVAVAPPTCALPAVAAALQDAPITLAAQNVHPAPEGAFTGEVSVPMLADLGVKTVIVGHSERRTLFQETDDQVRAKVEAVLAGGLSVILCVGESEAQRDAGQTLSVVGKQLDIALQDVDADHLTRVTVAYEPVWAIGTGRTATPEQAGKVHGALRQQLATRYGESGANVVLLYGGSVKPGNAGALFAQTDIDGGLIGGASLKAADFAAIVAAARSPS